jgi:hypothetical protein
MVETEEGNAQAGIDERERVGVPVTRNEVTGTPRAGAQTRKGTNGCCRVFRKNINHFQAFQVSSRSGELVG